MRQKMSMNILIINHYAGSNIHGMEYRPYYLSREWIKHGHNVMIVAASFSHLRIQQPELMGNITEDEIEGIRYVWLKTPHYQGNGVRRGINMFSFIMQLLLYKGALIREFRPDVVVASSTYPLDIYPARLIAREVNAKLFFEVHDLWPLTLIQLGDMSRRHPFILLLQWAENLAYRAADRVISILPHADSYMIEHGMAPYKFTHIPNGINVSEWEDCSSVMPEQHRETLANLKEEGHLIVGYAGAHGISNALSPLIEATQLLQNQPVTIVLVGEGPLKKSLQEKAVKSNLQNIAFLPPVSRLAIPSLLASMDVLFLSLQKKSLYKYGVSLNKLMDYMMAGKPIIYAFDEGNNVVKECGCGISIPSENPEAIAEAIKKMMAMKSADRQGLGLRGREYILAYHDYRVLANKFMGLF